MTNRADQTTLPRERTSVALHYILCSFSLLLVLYKLGIYLGQNLSLHLNNNIEYSDWALSCLTKEKPAQLLGYFLPAFGFFLYFALSHLHLSNYIRFKKSLSLPDHLNYTITLRNLNGKLVNLPLNNAWLSNYAFALLSWNILICALTFHHTLLFAAIPLWIFVFLHPYLPVLAFKPAFSLRPWIQGLGILILAFMVSQLWTMFTSYFHQSAALISNDYLEIPEYTRLGSGAVDNLHYINQKRLGGLLTYDPRLKQQPQLHPGKDFITVKPTKDLLELIRKTPLKYAYVPYLKGLFILNNLTEEETRSLCEVLTSSECKEVLHFNSSYRSISRRSYISSEWEFIKKNQYELSNQVLAGHFFHHHHAFLGPVSSLLLGKPINQTVYLYGWFNTLIMAKGLQYWGKIDFSSYLKLSFVIYPLYYSLLLLAAFILFRNLWYVLFVGILSIGSCFMIGFEALHMAPGFNPFRHFFDIFVLVSFYGYLIAQENSIIRVPTRNESAPTTQGINPSPAWETPIVREPTANRGVNLKSTFYLLLAIGFSLLAYLGNKEFGLIIYLSLLSAILFKFIETTFNRTEIFSLIAGISSIFVITHYLPAAPNPTSLYSFTGVSVPTTNYTIIKLFLIILSFSYMLLLFRKWHNVHLKYLATYLFIYAQATLIYYLWFFEKGHLLTFLPIWAFLTAVLFKEFLTYTFFYKFNRYFPVLVLILFVSFYVPAALKYKSDQTNYLSLFKQHKIFVWDMPRAQFISTMDPAPFWDGIHLIQKYSTEKGIYIISKYDNLLPFLADRYSSMPFLQTDLSLVSKKEMDKGVQAILKNKPEYLFVDSDIEFTHLGAVYNINDPASRGLQLHDFSLGRSLVQENLGKLFALIKQDYRLMEKGQLISVYQKVANQAAK